MQGSWLVRLSESHNRAGLHQQQQRRQQVGRDRAHFKAWSSSPSATSQSSRIPSLKGDITCGGGQACRGGCQRVVLDDR
jgi:hypothetical protein